MEDGPPPAVLAASLWAPGPWHALRGHWVQEPGQAWVDVSV